MRWRLDGNIVHAHLEAAWQLIVNRHEMLRTSFTTIDGEPYQRVEPSVPFRVRLIDLTTLPDDAAEAEAERIASIEARISFDIAVAPLLRVTHVRVSHRRSVVLVTAHHIVCDGWSIGVLAREMGECYVLVSSDRSAAWPTLSHTYADYVAWEAEGAQALHAGLLETLRAELHDFEPFEIVPDRPRPPVQSANGEIVSILIERSTTNALSSVAAAAGSTLFMAAYAVLLVLLARSSGRSKIAIGTQIAGREEVQFESLVGTFVNTVVLRADLSGDPSFNELLEIARDTVSDAFDMRHVPLEELVKIVNPRRDLSRNALFSINFIYQRSFVENATFGSVTFTDLPSASAGPICDLNFFMVERQDGWRVSCEYNTDLFRRKTVEGLLRRFVGLMQSLTATPAAPISQIPVMTDNERASVIARSTGPVTDYGRDASVGAMFTQYAVLAPAAVAVVDPEKTLTYAELDRASNRLARHLEQTLGKPGTVGVALARSSAIPVVLLAILKSGATYVPLDPSYPKERLAFMLADAGIDAIISEPGAREQLPSNGLPIVDLSTDAATIERYSAAPIERTVRSEDRAYIMYTSGSTGEPKGVGVTHRGILRLVRNTNYVDIAPDDTVLQYAPLTFDASTFEIWAPLLNGGRLAIAPPGPLTLAELDRTLQRFNVTTLWLTAGLFREAVDAQLDALSTLRRLLTGGDVVSPSHAQRFLERNASVELINGYGPTENTTFSCCFAVPPTMGIATHVPIGRPIANTTAFVLDQFMQLVPPGVVGELCVGGDGLAIEYIGRPDLTAERFIHNRFVPDGGRLYRTGDQARQDGDGVIEFLGRVDEQVKIRGFRVELGEIQTTLAAHPAVADAFVAAADVPGGDRTLVAYVIPGPAGADTFDVATVRTWLASRLPAYALPSLIVAVDAFPLTPNGKVDLRALSVERSGPVVDVRPADSAIEARLVTLLGTILGLAAIDREADLFALGFHSMLALRLVARVQADFGAELSLRSLYERPTIRAIAEALAASLPLEPPPPNPVVPYNADGTLPPLIFLHGDLFADGLYARQLAAALGPDQPVYAVSPHGTAGLPLLDDVRAMGASFATLIRTVQPRGPYRLGGFCASGLVAYEVARHLRASGDVVDRLVLLNASPMPPAKIEPLDMLVRRIGANAKLTARVRDVLCYNLARAHAALVSGPRGIAAFFRYFVDGHAVAQLADPLEPERPFEHRRTAAQTMTSFAHVVAALTYHPGPYDGTVTLVWGEDQTTMFDDPTMGWGAVARDVRVVRMRGGHVGSLRGRIDELAAHIRAAL